MACQAVVEVNQEMDQSEHKQQMSENIELLSTRLPHAMSTNRPACNDQGVEAERVGVETHESPSVCWPALCVARHSTRRAQFTKRCLHRRLKANSITSMRPRHVLLDENHRRASCLVDAHSISLHRPLCLPGHDGDGRRKNRCVMARVCVAPI